MMVIDSPEKINRIKELNDAFRATFVGGVVMLSAGVEALDAQAKETVLARVRSFDMFTDDNDPHGEHDYGSFDLDNVSYGWKIEYYDRVSDLMFASEDPTDPTKTTRVLTIFLSEER